MCSSAPWCELSLGDVAPQTVAALLQAAAAAHGRYSHARGVMAQGQMRRRPDLLACGQAVRDALAARIEAHALDPQHTDPAWIADQQAMHGQSHDAMVTFYASYLARDLTRA
jgi:hypothetical protein